MNQLKPLLLLTVLWSQALAAETPEASASLALDRGQAYELTRAGNQWTARVYVTPKAAAGADRITVALRAVANGTRTDPALTGLFLPPRRVPEKGPITAFDLLTKAGAEVPPGTYDVLLAVTGPGGKPEPLTLQATVPPAVLKAPSTLVITRVLGLDGEPGGYSPPLLVQETGRKSPAALNITQQDNFADANGVYGGQLQFDAASVEAGRSAAVPYRVQGDFPLGTAKANLSVLSAQTESPVAVAVEVRTRESRLLLLGIIVFGLMLGFLMRNVLQQRVQFGEARQKAFDELKKLGREREAVPDAVFRAAVDKAITHLKNAIVLARASKLGDLSTQVTNAEKALADAEKKLAEDAAAAGEEIKAMVVVVKTAWRLPPQILDAIGDAAKAVDRAQLLNKGQDPTAAAEALRTARAGLATLLTGYARSWKQDAEAFAGGLAGVAGLFLTDERKDFSDQVKAAGALSSDINDRLEDDAAATLKALLAALDNARERLKPVLRAGAAGVLRTFEAMAGELAGVAAAMPEPAVWVEAQKSTTSFSDWLRGAADRLSGGRDLGRKAQALRGGWKDAIEAQGADAKTVKLMADGQYREAAAALATSLTPEESIQGDALSRMQSALGLVTRGLLSHRLVMAGAGADAAGAVSAGVEPPPEPGLFESFYSPKRRAASIEVLEVRSFRQLIAARWLLSILSAIGLAAVGYWLFADKFVGTSGDLMTAFFWGFTTDISLDALISTGTQKKAGG